MAHFAKIENNFVSQVIVLNNEVLKDEDGIEQESIGIAFCQSLYGDNTQWVQTSYNASFKNKYAGIGDFYDIEKDEFIDPIIEEEAPTE
jgi:hypothetical protein